MTVSTNRPDLERVVNCDGDFEPPPPPPPPPPIPVRADEKPQPTREQRHAD